MESLKTFKVEEVVGDKPQAKQLAVVGRLDGSDEQALVIVTKKHLPKDKAAEILSADTKLKLQFENDVYSKYDAWLPGIAANATIDMMYPATELHIKKHRDQEFVMIRESPNDYEQCTLPYIKSISLSRIQWVYNALDKKAEADRIIYEDENPYTGFMVHPDLKWDQKNLEELYCLVLCHRRDIRCLRDLDASCLTLLKSIRQKGAEVIAAKYGIGEDQMRIYVHYPPSYYHFHVHFTHINSFSAGSCAGKAHLLDDIIENIEQVDTNYYKTRSLAMIIGKQTPHWEFLKRTNSSKSSGGMMHWLKNVLSSSC